MSICSSCPDRYARCIPHPRRMAGTIGTASSAEPVLFDFPGCAVEKGRLFSRHARTCYSICSCVQKKGADYSVDIRKFNPCKPVSMMSVFWGCAAVCACRFLTRWSLWHVSRSDHLAPGFQDADQAIEAPAVAFKDELVDRADAVARANQHVCSSRQALKFLFKFLGMLMSPPSGRAPADAP